MMKKIIALFIVAVYAACCCSVVWAQDVRGDCDAQLRELRQQHRQLKDYYHKTKKELAQKRKKQFHTLGNTPEEKKQRAVIDRDTKERLAELRADYKKKKQELCEKERQLKLKRKQARRLTAEAKKEMRGTLTRSARRQVITQELDAWERKQR